LVPPCLRPPVRSPPPPRKRPGQEPGCPGVFFPKTLDPEVGGPFGTAPQKFGNQGKPFPPSSLRSPPLPRPLRFWVGSGSPTPPAHKAWAGSFFFFLRLAPHNKVTGVPPPTFCLFRRFGNKTDPVPHPFFYVNGGALGPLIKKKRIFPPRRPPPPPLTIDFLAAPPPPPPPLFFWGNSPLFKN